MTYPSEYPQPQAPQQQAWAGEPPLWAPYYGAPFPAAIKRFFQKYATFSGRASRSEYWWWALVSLGVSIILNLISGTGASAMDSGSPSFGFGTILILLWSLAVLVPSLALSVRRLHDANFSGWLLLLLLIPILGAIALLVFMILPPNPAGQRFDQRA